MKKLVTIILALTLLCAGAAHAVVSSDTNINYGSGGTTVQNAIQALEDELDDIYTHVNALYRLQGAASAPTADNDTYDVWMDTSATPPVLKYWDGDSFDSLTTAAAFTSTVTMNAAFIEFTKNVILTRTAADTLTCAASAAAPATVAVASGSVYQNTSAVTVSFPGTTASGVWDIVAAQSGSTTTFTLAKQTSPYTVSAGERIVGQAKFDTDANDFVWVRSYEQPEAPDAQMPQGYFHAYAAHNSVSIPSATLTKATLATEASDFDALFADSRYSPTVAGYYRIAGSCSFPSTTTYTLTSASIYKNGSGVAQDIGVNDVMPQVDAVLYNDGNDYFEVYCYQANAGSAAVNLQSILNNDSAMWGYYLGRKY